MQAGSTVSMDKDDRIKTQVRLRSPKEHQGENTPKLCSQYLDDWTLGRIFDPSCSACLIRSERHSTAHPAFRTKETTEVGSASLAVRIVFHRTNQELKIQEQRDEKWPLVALVLLHDHLQTRGHITFETPTATELTDPATQAPMTARTRSVGARNRPAVGAFSITTQDHIQQYKPL